jgi:hypothetical protein
MLDQAPVSKRLQNFLAMSFTDIDTAAENGELSLQTFAVKPAACRTTLHALPNADNPRERVP